MILVWLHECGGITRIEIHNDRILWSEPEEWKKVDNITHEYCNGCSDHPDIVYEKTHCCCDCQTHQEGTCVKCGKTKRLDKSLEVL